MRGWFLPAGDRRRGVAPIFDQPRAACRGSEPERRLIVQVLCDTLVLACDSARAEGGAAVPGLDHDSYVPRLHWQVEERLELQKRRRGRVRLGFP